MHKLVLIRFLLLMICSTNTLMGQQISDEQLAREYRVRAMKFENMTQTGTKMMVGGTLAVATGIYILASANWEEDPNQPGSYTTSDESAVVGFLVTAIGIPLSAGGIIIHIIGRKKSAHYFEKAKNLSVHANRQSIGITLLF